MAMVINSNIQSLNAQRHLNNSLDAQNTATERLSSGLRINSAKDDAAGLAIANRMTSQVQGLNQAVRNANDGAALIQTAEGGLEETTNILQRMRELSIQSANGTYDTGNRNTLNAEVKQLQLEINRIGETTSFNGLNILDGSQGEVKLQVGENANQTIAFEISEISTKKLGSGGGADIIGEAGAGTLLANVQAITATVNAGDGTLINGILLKNQLNAVTLKEALTDINTQLAGSVIVDSMVEVSATTKGDGIISGVGRLDIAITNQDASITTIQIKDTTGMEDLVDKINEKAEGLITAELNDDGYLMISGQSISTVALSINAPTVLNTAVGTITATTQARLTIEEGTATNGITVDYQSDTTAHAAAIGVDQRLTSGVIESGTAGTLASLGAGDLVLNGVELKAYDNAVDYDNSTLGTAGQFTDAAAWINLQSNETGVVAAANTVTSNITLQSVSGAEISIDYKDANAAATKGVLQFQETNDVKSAGANVSNIDITTAEGAQKAIKVLDDAITQISETRGDLGAISNRLDYTTRNLSNISENAASARSAIMDADFAAESANLSRAQVLQQAGNAMLAQANSRPQQVLSLLQ